MRPINLIQIADELQIKVFKKYFVNLTIITTMREKYHII